MFMQSAGQKATRYLEEMDRKPDPYTDPMEDFVSLFHRVKSDPVKKLAVMSAFTDHMNVMLSNNKLGYMGKMIELAQKLPDLDACFDAGILNRTAKYFLDRAKNDGFSYSRRTLSSRRTLNNWPLDEFLNVYRYVSAHPHHHTAAVDNDAVTQAAGRYLKVNLGEKFLELYQITRDIPHNRSAIAPEMVRDAVTIFLDQSKNFMDVSAKLIQRLKSVEDDLQPEENFFSPKNIAKLAQDLLVKRQGMQFLALRNAVCGIKDLEEAFTPEMIQNAIGIFEGEKPAGKDNIITLRALVRDVPEQASVFTGPVIASAMEDALGKVSGQFLRLYKSVKGYPEQENAITGEMIEKITQNLLRYSDRNWIVEFADQVKDNPVHNAAFHKNADIKTIPVAPAHSDRGDLHVVFNLGASIVTYVQGPKMYQSLGALRRSWANPAINVDVPIIRGLEEVAKSDMPAAQIARTELNVLCGEPRPMVA